MSPRERGDAGGERGEAGGAGGALRFKSQDHADVIHIPGLNKTIRKRGATRLDLRDPYFHAVATSWPRFFLLALGCVSFFHIVFAVLYVLRPGAVAHMPPGDLLYAYFFSVETLATVGYGEMSPASTYGHVVASVEIDLGVIFTAILTGILFVRFSRPKPSFRFASHAVVARYEDAPALMVRVANGRLSLLTNAHARFVVLLSEGGAEGRANRRFHDLKLVHDAIPVFPLTWTLIHVLDADSPLSSLAADDLERADAQLFVTLKARDTSLSTELQDVQSYDHSHILFGARYASAVISEQADGPVADLGKLNETEADEGPVRGGELI